MIAALCPEKLCGWVNKVSDKSVWYLNEDLKKLPLLGGWMGQRVTANIESIIKAAPDVIIYATDRLNLGTKNDRPDNIQAKTGIPVVAVADELAGTPKAFRFLGDILSSEERGEKLAAYCEEKLAMIGEAVAKIPEDKIVSIYYAEGKGGLATDPSRRRGRLRGTAPAAPISSGSVGHWAVYSGSARTKIGRAHV